TTAIRFDGQILTGPLSSKSDVVFHKQAVIWRGTSCKLLNAAFSRFPS
ncbi:unnamed protein product, partial [Oikopleura dioica]